MTTTDNYQGEESDIVLLSLVRSNAEGQAGFVKIQNRVCVALSRARHGMYVVGNFSMMAGVSPLWKKICGGMEVRGCLGDGLTLQCPVHKGVEVEAKIASDFLKCPHGGCTQPCEAKMDCGHVCKLLCHPISHDFIKCNQPCTKDRPDGCSHKCPKACWQICGPCGVKVQKLRKFCNHTIGVPCHKDADSVTCPSLCGEAMICGHSCPEKCHVKGHDKLRYKCPLPCTRTPLCGHPCRKPCHEQCGDCQEIVSRELSCGHAMDVSCSTDVLTVICSSNCCKNLPCGHLCSLPCGHVSVCDQLCPVLVKKTMPKCRNTPRHWQEVPCHLDVTDILCQKECKEYLVCGHICSGTCGTCLSTDLNLPFPLDEDDIGGVISLPSHMPCNKPCNRTLDCNHKCPGNHICGDDSTCPTCVSPCAVVCPHGPCQLSCSEPCIPCMQPCAYSCTHKTCTSLCSGVHLCGLIEDKYQLNDVNDIASVFEQICSERCPRSLSCGHQCIGICGEVCPSMCKVCNPYEVRERLAQSLRLLQYPPSPSRLSLNMDSSSMSFIQLFCGHSFEVETFDLNAVVQYNNGKVLACPECGQTVMGTHRYSSMVRDKLKLLEPVHLQQQEKELCKEVTNDLQNNVPMNEIIDHLQTMLVIKDKGEGYSKLGPAISLMLGLVNLRSGDLLEARLRLRSASSDLHTSSWIRHEAFLCLGFIYLNVSDEKDVSIAIEEATSENLKLSLSSFEDSMILPADSTVSTSPFGYTSSDIEDIMRDLKLSITNKKKTALEKKRQVAELKDIETERRKEEEKSTVPPTRPSDIVVLPTVHTTGGSALHSAAARGRLMEVKSLVADGADCCQKDDLGNTPLLCAAENGHLLVVEFLSHCSPWHTVNKAQKTFLDILMSIPGANTESGIIDDIRDRARRALGDDTVDPSYGWAAAKHFDCCACVALDELMDMIGLKAVKQKALELFHTIRRDLSRPVEARVTPKQSMNFLFLGNPGSGKTTVARIFGKILSELNLRSDNFVETSGQKLLQEGASKFPALLQKVTPGILFIDEIYQLDPVGNADGRAITNALMEAAENDRSKLTVIVAGYRDDVVEKWCSSNPGIMSRFPFEIMFEDFNESELRTIFLNNVRSMHWQLERYVPINDTHLSSAVVTPTVDVATVAARRLYRCANRKGFGNARAVRVMVEQAQRAASKRQKQEQLTGQVLSSMHKVTMTLIDVIGPPIDITRSPLVAELMAMTGLHDVKKAVMGLLQMSVENYRSELRGEAVLDISLHRMFLGNPGTGKTTIAKVFGRILVELGYLTNGEVIVVGASKLVGGVMGETPKIVNNLIDSVLGKVLVIDEAYVLARTNNMYGKEALDTLVERVQGTPGENFAVILCGYEEDMMTMLRDGNPGLSRRFRSEDAFKFADYNDEELTSIMVDRSKAVHLHISEELAKDVVLHVLAKQRAKPNFGNVGAINNVLDIAKEKMMRRDNREKKDGRFVLIPTDFYEETVPNAALKVLDSLVNAEHIRSHVTSLQKRVKRQQREGGDPKKFLKNYVFVGSPGTGKTTVARAFGEIFYQLGLLSSDAVVECKAMELIGEYVGQSAAKMRNKMKEARGGVLFIDEAYGLDPTRSAFAKDSLEQLLSNMTDPEYEGNMIIIIAGYSHEIEVLMKSNPGFYRRFSERIEFPNWAPTDCLELLVKKCATEAVELPESLYDNIKYNFKILSEEYSGWGNAGDVNTVHDKMSAAREDRCDDEDVIEGGYTREDIDVAFNIMMRQRARELPLYSKAAVIARALFSPQQDPRAELHFELSGSSYSQKTEEKRNESEMIDLSPVPSQEMKEQEEGPLDPETVWSSLDEALQEMEYDIHTTAIMLQSGDLPSELIALVAQKVSSRPERVKPMLVAQCPVLLPRVLNMIEQINQELMLQRLAREAIERADEEERVRLVEAERQMKEMAIMEKELFIEAERQRKEMASAERFRLVEAERYRKKMAIMERVKMIGRCCMGFEWLKSPGGYRCAGGSHFVSDSMVNCE